MEEPGRDGERQKDHGGNLFTEKELAMLGILGISSFRQTKFQEVQMMQMGRFHRIYGEGLSTISSAITRWFDVVRKSVFVTLWSRILDTNDGQN